MMSSTLFTVTLATLASAISQPDSGFSINTQLETPTHGFMVALYPEREHVLEQITPESLEQYVSQNADLLESNTNLFFGAWNDPNSSRVYLDISARFNDLTDAKTAAQKTNQLAIYDVQNRISIPVLN